MAKLTSTPALDRLGHYPFQLIERNGRWWITLDLARASPHSQWIQHLHRGLRLTSGTSRPMAPEGDVQEALQARRLYFACEAPIESVSPLELTFTMESRHGAQPVAQLVVNAATQLVPTPAHPLYQFAVCETRALGMDLQPDERKRLPYDRAAREGFDPLVHAPATDVHTHSTAQIKAEDLLKLAHDADQRIATTMASLLAARKVSEAEALAVQRICYPVGLLGEEFLNLLEPGQKTCRMRPRGFSPLKDERREWETERDDKGNLNVCEGIPVSELTPAQRERIIRKMEVASDATMDFSDMDPELYRYRNPLAKHPALAKGIIAKIAEDYAAMGVAYAELSTASMLDPDWFQAMVEAIDAIEREGVGPNHARVTLRFLINLSRTSTLEESAVWLRKAKHLLRHPYIKGVDLTGYEANKTADFHWVLSNLLQWASISEKTDLKPEDGWNFLDWMTCRVHGGETMKHLGNVGHAIDLAYQYQGRVRVGHAMHHDLTAAQRRSLNALVSAPEKDRFATERCMDANQVYRSEKLVHDQPPFLPAPKFLGSDGGGALGVSPVSLAYSALAAGMTLDQLKENRAWEQGYIAREAARDTAHRRAFETHYGDGQGGLERFLSEYRALLKKFEHKAGLRNYLPEEFDGKRPFVWAGPSGTSWTALDRQEQETIEQIAEFVVRVANPKTVYPIFGRVQNEGASRALDKAILRHNTRHATDKFAVLGRYNGADKGPGGEVAESMTWVQAIPGERDMVPSNMIKFAQQHRGKVIATAGSDFSAGMVGLAQDRKVPYAMQVPKKGMFHKLAKTSNTRSRFSTFDEFVARVFETEGPDCFFQTEEERTVFLRPGVDLRQIASEVSAERRGRSDKES